MVLYVLKNIDKSVLSKIFDNEFYDFEKFSKDFDKNYPCRRLEKPV